MQCAPFSAGCVRSTFHILFALILLSAIFSPNAAMSHGLEGNRFFPPTISTDDPFAVDELIFPTVSRFRQPASADQPREVDISGEFDKEIFPRFALGFSGQWTQLDPEQGKTVNGFQNFALKAKYQLLESASHEFIFSAGTEWEMGGTGSKQIDAETFSTFTPTIYLGKGFGDLPAAVDLLRAFAVTATLGITLPTKAANPNQLEWACAVEYSLPYLDQHVKETGLPHPIRDLIPLVEFSFQSPLNRGGGATTGTINPGILYESRYFQLGAEAVIPVNSQTGSQVGFIASMSIYIDDLLPRLFGHPLLFGGSKDLLPQPIEVK